MTRFLVTTALSLILANSAFAQSSADRHTNSNVSKDPQAQSDSAARRDNSTPRTDNAPQSQPSSSSTSDRSSSANGSANPANSNQPSKSADSDRGAANQQQPSRSESAESNARTQGAQGASNSKSTSQQTQNPAPSNQAENPSTPANTSSQAQQNAPRDNTNQAQQTSPRDNAGQPDRTNGSENADRASRDNDRGTRDNDRANRDNDSGRADGASVKISEQQRTQVNEAVSKLNVKAVTNVNFSLSVGTVVPRDVQLATLPRDVIDIVPEYRGYSFALVKDEIVIVDPATYKIVAVLPYSGRSTAAAPAPSGRSKVTFSDKEREIIRKQARTRVEGRTVERRTTGSSARSEIRMGERVPESVEIEEFPAEVYREAPTLREHRYIHRDNHTYIVEPGDRRVIEDIE
jgi:hypothetical protein